MMRKYLKESFHWLHLALFKPITLEAKARPLSKRQALRVYLRAVPVQLLMVFGVVTLVGLVCEVAGYPFYWSIALVRMMSYGLACGMAMGLVVALGIKRFDGLFHGLAFGLVAGVGIGGGIGLVGPLGTHHNLALGFTIGSAFTLALGWIHDRMVVLTVVLIAGLALSLVFGIVLGPAEALQFVAPYTFAFLFSMFRPFQLVPYTVQWWRSKRAKDPFASFCNSPVYWDEAIAMPLPLLSDWLVRLATLDRERGMSEMANIARLPYQRRAAQRALVSLLVRDLQRADSIEKMAAAPRLLAILPSNAEYLPAGLDDAARHIGRVVELASDYLTRVTIVGQMNILGELSFVIDSFRDAMAYMIKPPLGPALQSVASRWLDIVKAEEAECGKLLAFEPIPNPFVVGNPLMVRDRNLFKGRKDIIVAIEENIINPAQRPALLLYGRRRIGKTSTLLNLPGLLSSQFLPVFIDCQDAKWREGNEAFCYHLAASIYDALNQRSLVETRRRPQLEQFERYAFTRLGEYLDQIEESSRAAAKQILLTFDEYEKLEEGINASKLTTEVLNQVRTIVQHRERIVMLFSGGHRFEEMRTINWSDYLINVKTLELSFLTAEDARELITEPVPLLQYESGVIEQIIETTHCQPYLLQAVASDLVNFLNSERRMLATAADLEIAVEKVLVTAQAYFFYTWTGDCTETEREVLRMIATGDTDNRTLAEHQASLQSLCQKEILERHASGYQFSIELFRRWVLKNQTAQPLSVSDPFDALELVGAPRS